MPNEIGARIALLRHAAGVTGRELARRVGVAQSYVSKIETGKINPNLAFCLDVATALELAPTDRETLVSLVELFKAEHHPLTKEENALSLRQKAIKRLEDNCRVIRIYQPTLIPGLLQTKRYANAVFQLYSTDRKQIEASVNERLERQQWLLRPNRILRCVISESAFATTICPVSVLQEQIEVIINLMNRPRWTNVRVSLLKCNVRLTQRTKVPMGGFEILDESLVMVDTLDGFMTYRHPHEIETYRDTFEALDQLTESYAAAFEDIHRSIALRDVTKPSKG